jgi:hypothetical protein
MIILVPFMPLTERLERGRASTKHSRLYTRAATDGCTSADFDHFFGTELLNVQVKRIGGGGFFFLNFELAHVRVLGSAPRFNEG